MTLFIDNISDNVVVTLQNLETAFCGYHYLFMYHILIEINILLKSLVKWILFEVIH